MGQKWYQSKAYDLLYCRWIFILIFTGFVPLNLKKQFFGVLQNFEVAFLDRVARTD
jgi:hypothetical protein